MKIDKKYYCNRNERKILNNNDFMCCTRTCRHSLICRHYIQNDTKKDFHKLFILFFLQYVI